MGGSRIYTTANRPAVGIWAPKMIAGRAREGLSPVGSADAEGNQLLQAGMRLIARSRRQSQLVRCVSSRHISRARVGRRRDVRPAAVGPGEAAHRHGPAVPPGLLRLLPRQGETAGAARPHRLREHGGGGARRIPTGRWCWKSWPRSRCRPRASASSRSAAQREAVIAWIRALRQVGGGAERRRPGARAGPPPEQRGVRLHDPRPDRRGPAPHPRVPRGPGQPGGLRQLRRVAHHLPGADEEVCCRRRRGSRTTWC